MQHTSREHRMQQPAERQTWQPSHYLAAGLTLAVVVDAVALVLLLH
jgi:hypothetical protein